MIPLDCTHQALATAARLEKLRAAQTNVTEAFYHLIHYNKLFDEKKYGWEGGPLHDPTVTAWLLRPELFKGRHVHVAIEHNSELTRGMSVVDWWGVTGLAPNAHVLREIDAEGYFAVVIERLSRL